MTYTPIISTLPCKNDWERSKHILDCDSSYQFFGNAFVKMSAICVLVLMFLNSIITFTLSLAPWQSTFICFVLMKNCIICMLMADVLSHIC